MGGVFARAFQSNGAPDGDIHTLYSSLVTGGEPPSIVTSASGTVIVSYSVYSGGSPYFEVYQTRLESTASFIGGTSGNDVLENRPGSNTIDGGAGIDTLLFGLHATNYAVSRDASSFIVRGFGDADTVRNVERVSLDGGLTSISFAEFEQRAFDPFSYLVANPDLYRAFGLNAQAARDHYFTFGINEGRGFGDFDALTYIASNADLIAAFGTDVARATEHYLAFGRSEGRSIDAFDSLAYAASNVDLARAFGTNADAAALHYIQFGVNEGRAVNGFDPLLYGASNRDLALLLGNDGQALISHYLTFGADEGRAVSGFDPLLYAASHLDLARAFALNDDAALAHYLEFGAREGRATTGFDAVAYLDAHADLRAAGLNAQQAVQHWLEFGADEGRSSVRANSVSVVDDPKQAFEVIPPAATRGEDDALVVGFTDDAQFDVRLLHERLARLQLESDEQPTVPLYAANAPLDHPSLMAVGSGEHDWIM